MASIQKYIGFSPHEISSMVNEVVVRQHAENAAFLWTQRERAVKASRYRLKDIAKLDERVEANVEGLRVAGEVGWKLCEEALEQQDPGEFFAAAVLAFGGNDFDRIEKVLELSQVAVGLDRPIMSALGWLEMEQVENHLADLVASENPRRRRIGVAGYTVHRLDPDRVLTQTLSDADPRVRARALKAAGELGRVDLLSHIRRASTEDDSGCCFNALWSAIRLGERTVNMFRKLEAIAEAGGKCSEVALSMLLRTLSLEGAKQWRRQLRDNPERLRLATKGIGILGDPGLVPELLVLMEKKEISREAGESFSMITGVDLASEDLDRDEPQGLKPQEAPNATGLSDEDLEVEITEDPDADLSWPHPELVSKWWRQHQSEYRVGVRYLCGKEITSVNLMEVLKTGYQRQRASAAIELALREPRQPLFEVRALGKRQQQSLGLWNW